ncbi:LCP family protein [Blastococcus capsensis]|uniref:LCP family protein n=1 Tax=Blastococcus capsensis TaxID=1564163 RepID=UPI00254065E6|nr:LCP family protein [Blastococcus capsensis]MDK3257126.1 LCP family protein [Blastococcus capsensis]
MSRHRAVEDLDEWGASIDEHVDEPPRRAGRRRRILAVVGLGLVAVLLLVAGGAWWMTHRYAGNLDRLDGVFAGLDEAQRPPAPSGPATTTPLTFLVVGSDTTEDVPAGETPDGRSDVMMVVRFEGDRQRAQVISLPRDSWVSIPGVGMAKLNAAYAYGGPTLLVQTVEQLTGTRIDHYAAVDFAGFVEMTDALGGVEVHVAQTTSNGPYTYQAGVNHLDGREALYYVRQRYGLPGGDFDRVKRQQQYLRSVYSGLAQKNVLSDVGALDEFLVALTDTVAVDEGLSNSELLSVAYDLRSLRPDAVTFLTAPVTGTGREGSQSVVYLDPVRAEQMWTHLRSDTLGDHTAEFAVDTLQAVPN